MPNKENKQHYEFMDRTCDALVLAYSPANVLGMAHGDGFYIPPGERVGEALEHALIKILGQKNGSFHWDEAVKWETIANLKKLEKRISEGTHEVFSGGCDIPLNRYLSLVSGVFEHFWICMTGDMYRFVRDEREKAEQKFTAYWTEEERMRWKQIHKFMRECTKREYKKK